MIRYAGAVTLLFLPLIAITLLNWRRFPRLTASLTLADDRPAVSVLIPARNEAGVIGPTIAMLLDQGQPPLELLVLDDGSWDGMAEIVRRVGEGNERLRVLPGRPPPTGWTGKNWACAQLADAARGSRLLFTDAEVRWEPGAQPLFSARGLYFAGGTIRPGGGVPMVVLSGKAAAEMKDNSE